MNDKELIAHLDGLPFESCAWKAAQRLRKIRKHLEVAVKASDMGMRVIVGNLVFDGGNMADNSTLDGCDKQTRKKFNDTCRESMKLKLLQDIMADLTVCEIEGWDKTEYINGIFDLINKVKNGDDANRNGVGA